ncbi:hypothetical protein DL93DRAFT_1155787 [Clavulina sp. PMI_390]|nr:hypothetical protein DL93DRAFT_1155787 [Clavulina sp. PMI_390]
MDNLKYFYYQVVEDGLARTSQQSFDNRDTSIGRVVATRFFPPTVKTFKASLWALEGIRPSRVISFKLTSESPEEGSEDTVALAIGDPDAPGAYPQSPFIILVTRLEDGVADVAISPGSSDQALSSDCPQGWAYEK